MALAASPFPGLRQKAGHLPCDACQEKNPVNYEQKYRDTGNIDYRDKRITNTWYLGLAYLIVLVDAYVDAYLFKFDETIKMTYQYIPEEKAFTVGVNIEF